MRSTQSEAGPQEAARLPTISGEGGIRTLGTIAGTPVFETGAFDHSATSPTG
jgi:hypothetical protein